MTAFRIALLVTLVTIVCPAMPEGEADFQVVRYTPGPGWRSDADYESQPGLEQHRRYLAALYDDGNILMAGRFEGADGAMVILGVRTREQAEGVASRDPAVIDGILRAEVLSWRVDLTTMRQIKRSSSMSRDPDAPFRVESVDPDAPINLKDVR